MMVSSFRRVSGGLAICIVLAAVCRAADIANLQLVVASPDPVQAGTKVNFQVIVVNAGSRVWEKESYMVEAELYTLKREYLLKSDRVQGTKRVDPGGKDLVFVPVEIPEYFSGIYYYRIFVYHGTERIATGRYTPIRVNPLPILPPKPPAVKLGGNAIFSFKSDTSNDWKDYTGNVSLNIVGRVLDRSVLFNLYTIHDQDDAVDIYTILLNYYGSQVQIAAGDILPEFGELTMQGAGLRGLSWEHRRGRFSTALVGARLIESIEGTTDADGVYRRMVYAGEETVSLPWGLTFSGNGVYGADIESSVEIPGPALTPEKSTVFGGGLVWQGFSMLTLEGQFASSSWLQDTKSTAAALGDSAYRADVEVEADYFLIAGYYQRTGPDFVSFGAPEANADRVTLNASADIYPLNFLSLSGGYNTFYDDLDNDPDIVRTTQQITSASTSLNFKTGTGVSGGYSLNNVFGELRDIQDNSTKTMTYGISQSFRGQSLALSSQLSNFRDKTNADSDLDTTTNSVNVNCAMGSRFSGSLGISLSENEAVIAGTVENNDSYSVSINQIIMKDKLTLQLWGTNTAVSNTDKSEDSAEVVGNMELTYVWKTDISVTVGASASSFADEMSPASNTHETGANIRVNYSF